MKRFLEFAWQITAIGLVGYLTHLVVSVELTVVAMAIVAFGVVYLVERKRKPG